MSASAAALADRDQGFRVCFRAMTYFSRVIHELMRYSAVVGKKITIGNFIMTFNKHDFIWTRTRVVNTSESTENKTHSTLIRTVPTPILAIIHVLIKKQTFRLW
uniref:Uncharacterized protein n=1 Tax=Steinernema glaseri TaxID=37863 RepID=A0A1I8ALJ8_9BILA